ncbi:MAG: hypothetical protein U0T11_01625 [Chitinophagaceae bacterium]
MKLQSLKTVAIVFLLIGLSATVTAQKIQYSRNFDQRGINVFEPSKKDSVPYEGFKIRIGGSFTQDYQSLKSTNKANYVATSVSNTTNKNLLYGIIKVQDSLTSRLNGFNLAMANLNFDIQIGDGIRVFLENYMSARHHNEFWVKGGYIQIDKLPMFNNPEWFTKYVRVKLGHFQPNFGDFQYRRSDGGNTIFNPFAENLILDAFTTEIGGEIYVFPTDNVMVMGGMSSGFINGNIQPTPDAVNSNGVVRTKRSPSIFGKIAYDKQYSKDLRFRLSASVYNNSNSQRNTLFAGDRTGSHYFGPMELAQVGGLPSSLGTSSATNAGPFFTSGRFDPGVANRVTAINIAPFVKFKGLELQGGYDIIKGSVYGDVTSGKWTKRDWNQVYGEVVYRFLKHEELYLGARYVSANGQPSGLKYGVNDGSLNGQQAKVNINRLALAAGYFATKNMLLKLEYVSQAYNDFPWADYRYKGKFSGLMIEAVIGF